MPGPELAAIELTGEERLGLETLVRRHMAGQQVVLRGRIVLAAADGVNQSTIAARATDEGLAARRGRQSVACESVPALRVR